MTTAIEKHIIQGLKNGYSQNLVLKTDFDTLQSTTIEYLFTVNVAQELIKWNNDNSYKYGIFLEYDATKFVQQAFEQAKFEGEDIFNLELLNADTHCSCRTGRIDIAITQETTGLFSYDKSLVGIELKGIIKGYTKVAEDIKRLAHAMQQMDKISDNSIEACYCGFVWRLDNPETVFSDDDYDTKLEKFKKQVAEKLCKEYEGVNVTAEYHDIEKSTVSEVLGGYDLSEHELDEGEVSNMTGAVVATLIKISRK